MRRMGWGGRSRNRWLFEGLASLSTNGALVLVCIMILHVLLALVLCFGRIYMDEQRYDGIELVLCWHFDIRDRLLFLSKSTKIACS